MPNEKKPLSLAAHLQSMAAGSMSFDMRIFEREILNNAQ